jgi:hypothetical protein
MTAVVYFAIALFVPSIALAAPISVGGFTFSDGETAFADDASVVSDAGLRFDCTAGSTAATSFAQALAGSDITQCVNVVGGGSGVLEVLFNDNFIVNGAGTDLVIFEVSGPQATGTADARERFAVSVFDGASFSPFVSVDPVATGFHTPDPTLDVFAVQIDLTAFGLASGTAVDRIRLHLFDNGLGSKGADIVALGALNSAPALPEPSATLLLLVAAARRLTRRCS